MRLSFHRLARAELHRAADWYEARQPGLGDDLYAEVQRAMRLIRSYPRAHPEIAPGLRHCLTARFPYALIYAELGSDDIVIIAVAHTSRRPGYWRRRRISP